MANSQENYFKQNQGVKIKSHQKLVQDQNYSN
jgi:hypothetical protein